MRPPFRYCRDPLFWMGCCSYAANRWLVKPHCQVRFLHFYFNDCWLIPCALPPVLWAHRWLGLRRHDRFPGWGEMLGHLALWGILFEVLGPFLNRKATGDWRDALAYALGGVLSMLWWHSRKERSASDSTTRSILTSSP